MSRVTSLTSMSDQELNRWIKRIALLFVVVLVAFVAFYAVDRFRVPAAPLADQKVAALEEKVRQNPADTKSRGELADLYFAKHRFEDAIVQYSALIDAGKDTELASLGRGNAYRELKKWDEASRDYNKVIEIALTGEMANVDPSLEEAYYGLGMIALAQDKPGDAIEPLTKAIAMIRTDADALYALGVAYVQVDRPEMAITPLRSAVALVPTSWAEPYGTLATAYNKLGKPNLAAWANAMALFESGDAASAETELVKLVDGDAGVEAMVSLGLIKEVQADIAAAADWYAKALAKDPGNIPATMGFQRTHPIATPTPSIQGSTQP